MAMPSQWVRALPALFFVGPLWGCTGGGDDTSSPAAQSASAPADASVLAAPLNCGADSGDWPMYGQNVCNTRGASAGDPISPATASKLKVKWTYAAAGDISATPAVVAGQVYVPDWGGMLNRIDANTGKLVWSRGVADILGLSTDGGTLIDADITAADGAPLDTSAIKSFSFPVSRTTPVIADGNVVFTMGSAPASATIAAIDKDTAELKWRTSLDGNPSALITSSPALDGDTLYVGVSSGEEAVAGFVSGYPCCSFRGSVVALSASTGKILWKTYTIEDSVYFESDHKTPSGYAGVAIWSGTPTVDRKRGLLYVTTGNNYSKPKGATDPPPSGDHVESIVALDLKTGDIKWSSRMVASAGDVWTFGNFSGPDYDFGCPANLFQVTGDGGTRDIVGAGQKSGIYWAVSADDGGVLWKNQVGPGGHLGGIHWGPAVDGDHVYVGVNDNTGTAYKMGGKGPQAGVKTSVGSWAALDPATGKTVWQIANPAMTAPLNGASVNGPLAVVNGVVFAGSMDAKGTMYAIDGATGSVLWSFESGATVYSGPAIVGGVVYWGVGYPASRPLGIGSSGKTQLYAFELAK